MYFKDITDNSLSFFHKKVLVNFSMPLTDVLTSDLFKIEEIIKNSIYRIFPLFYCEVISSTNDSDRIIGSECIICQKSENTVLYFNSNSDSLNSPLSDFYYISEQGSPGFIVFYCFDNNNEPLPKVNANCVLSYYSNSALIGTFNIESDNDGYIVINKEEVNKFIDYENTDDRLILNVFLTHDELTRSYEINFNRVFL